MDFWEALIFTFSVQAFVLGIFILLRRSGDLIANFIWFVFLSLIAYHLFFNVLIWTNLNRTMIKRLDLVYLLPMALYGPVFYFYIRRVVTQKEIRFKSLYLHFIPFLVVLLLYIRYFLMPLDYRDMLIEKGTLMSYFLVPPCEIFGLLSLGILLYAIWTFRIFGRKYVGDKDMKIWLSCISVCFILFSLSLVTYYALIKLGMFSIQNDYAINISMALFAVLTTYFGQMHPKIFNGKSIKQVMFGPSKGKYRSSGLSQAVSQEYKERLQELIDKEELYLNSDLRLMDVAKSLGISRHHASQIINQHFNMTFSDFINRSRISEAQKLILENEGDYSMLEIAFRVGFNNKVSFYKSFKKFVGATPTEFLESHV